MKYKKRVFYFHFFKKKIFASKLRHDFELFKKWNQIAKKIII